MAVAQSLAHACRQGQAVGKCMIVRRALEARRAGTAIIVAATGVETARATVTVTLTPVSGSIAVTGPAAVSASGGVLSVTGSVADVIGRRKPA